MSRASHRFVSREKTGLARRAHVNPGSRITRGEKILRGGRIPERVRQNKFRHAYSAEAFRRLENHDNRRRHRLDADSRWSFVCGQSGERLLRCRAWDELQIEFERHEV